MKIAILGGGVSGLSLGYFLQKSGIDFEIFEAASIPGGLCRSDVRDGYVMDRAGGHIMFTKKEEVRAVWDEIFEADHLVQNERHTRILYGDRFVAYPFENGLGDLPPQDNFECLRDYIEAHFDRRNGATCPDNFRDWIVYRMGQAIGEKFMFPYNEKIWKSRLEDMGITWVAGRVPEAPVDDVLKSSLGIQTVGYAHQAMFQYPLRGGFQDITDRLARLVGEKLHLATPVTDVSKVGDSFRVNGMPFDRVVSTIPMNASAKLIEGLDQGTIEAATNLKFRGVASFLFGIPEEDVLPYSWIYLPFHEQGPANRVTYLSNYSPENAPEGRGSLLAEVTYEGDLEITDELVNDLETKLASSGLFSKGSVDHRNWAKNEFAYILYDHGFDERRARAIQGLEDFGILTLGRFGQYNYHNSDMCLYDSLRLSEKIAAMARC